MTHPQWPDGDDIKFGHLFRIPGRVPATVFMVDHIFMAGDTPIIGGKVPGGGAWASGFPMDKAERVLPPRPVAGEMPAELAAWLETTDLTGFDVRTNRHHRMDELLEWAKALLMWDEVGVDLRNVDT